MFIDPPGTLRSAEDEVRMSQDEGHLRQGLDRHVRAQPLAADWLDLDALEGGDEGPATGEDGLESISRERCRLLSLAAPHLGHPLRVGLGRWDTCELELAARRLLR